MADLRIASYNIKSGQHVPDGLEALAETLRALDPDIVSLQEVDRGTQRSGGLDQTARIAEGLGHGHFVFAPATDWPGGGEYGVALISRHRLEDVVVTPLWVPTDAGVHPSLTEPRALLSATVRFAGAVVRVFATHLGLGEAQRRVQIREIAAAVDQARTIAHPLVAGDLNCPPGGDEIAPLASRLRDAHDVLPLDARGTYPTESEAHERIVCDYVLVDPDVNVRSAKVFHDERRPQASDHYALVADLSIP